jgi:hypothetical protein
LVFAHGLWKGETDRPNPISSAHFFTVQRQHLMWAQRLIFIFVLRAVALFHMDMVFASRNYPAIAGITLFYAQ